MKELIGREVEKKNLKDFLNSSSSKLAVIYGRRRIGKSFLIEHSVQDYKSFMFEGIENQAKHDQLSHFIFQLKYYFGDKSVPRILNNWKEAFYLLYQLIKENQNCVIVFDEFQWMSNYRTEIVSDLKYIWDKFFSKMQNTNIILCGSIASFMINKVLKSKALYGRIDLEIHLEAFDISETCDMLYGRNLEECIEAFYFTGGVPKYLELLKNYSSIRLGIQELAFSRNGYFTQEYERIFISHFGKNIEYEQIVKVLIQSPDGLFRKNIAEKLKVKSGGQLSEYLFNLEKAGFISKFIPYNKDLNTKYKKYFISDSYIRFYFSFILPNMIKINSQTVTNLFIGISQSNQYKYWLGKNFELFCFRHAGIIADKLGFSAVDYRFGPYYRTRNSISYDKGFQIDLLFDRSDNVISLCEMKYKNKKIGVEIIDEVEKKVKLLEKEAGNKTIQRVLISKSEASIELLNKAYFYKIITLDQLVGGF